MCGQALSVLTATRLPLARPTKFVRMREDACARGRNSRQDAPGVLDAVLTASLSGPAHQVCRPAPRALIPVRRRRRSNLVPQVSLPVIHHRGCHQAPRAWHQTLLPVKRHQVCHPSHQALDPVIRPRTYRPWHRAPLPATCHQVYHQAPQAFTPSFGLFVGRAPAATRVMRCRLE